MSEAAALWVRIGAITGLSAALLIFVVPDRPAAGLPWPLAVPLGVCAGVALFSAITRSRPHLQPVAGSGPVVLAKVAFFGLWATNEEVVWRRVALGELLPAGLVPALVASTLGFALMHRTRWAVHLGTGGAFGAVYLSTGALAACVAAHWTYNVLVGAFVAGHRRAGAGVT